MMIMYAEVKNNGTWTKVGKVFDSFFEEIDKTDRVCDAIDLFTYEVFSGKKHIVTQDYTKFNTFDPETGLPADCSQEIFDNKYFTDRDVYSLTLEEIMHFDWYQEVYKLCYTTEVQYKKTPKGEKPALVRHFVLKDLPIVEPSEMDMILANPNLRKEKKYWVHVKYDKQFINELCEFFYKHSLPKLYDLKQSAEDVRVIYTFVS